MSRFSKRRRGACGYSSRMRILGAALLLAIAVGFATVSTSQRPDFSGTWVAVSDAPAKLPAAPSAIMGQRFTIKQDGSALTLTRPFRDDTMAVTYPLDGSRTTYKVAGRMCEGDAEYAETAVWEGDALALTIVGAIPAGGGSTRELSVKRVIAREGTDTIVVQGNITQAGKPSAVGTVYKRSNDAPVPAPKTRTKGAPGTIAQMAWLPGFWVGGTAPTHVEERWTPPASGSILGLARTLRGTSLGSFEFLCISERDGTLVYTALPDGRTTPTFFTLTSITESSATFENPTHDYPQLVRYTRQADGSLQTTISATGGTRAQNMVLKKQD